MVADQNNATDGDLLIAWALARAAKRFDREDYREAAKRLAVAIGAAAVRSVKAETVLLPAAFGFTSADQRDGPVVNLSYYIFPAFEELKAIAPDVDWEGLKATGLKLIENSKFGPLHLPSDWVALGGDFPLPAANFPRTFGYDAIRIPLYLAWDGHPEAGRARFSGLWNERLNMGPFVTDLDNGSALRPIDGTGFKLIAALSACVARGRPVPSKLIATRDNFYYPATMRLLSLAVIQERYSQCL
jgi:endoglucanase